MTYNPDIHHRRSIRLKDFDYSQAGAYFVTVCTWQREVLFGEIIDGEMVLNNIGRVVESIWCKLPKHFINATLDVYAVMPNHFHGILCLHDVGAMPTARPGSNAMPTARPDSNVMPTARPDSNGNNVGIYDRSKSGRLEQPGRAVGIAPTGPVSGSIGAIMAQFKSRVTKNIAKLTNNPGCPVWQKNFYERVIRNDDELSRAREYIVNNPLKWELDKENPVYCP